MNAIIKNFVLIYFKKTRDSVDRLAELLYKNLDVNRFDYVEKYFKITTSSIRSLYPNSNIHIISNAKNKIKSKFIWHYKKDLLLNNLAKFEIFDIINEPFMYLDLDVWILKKFTEEQIECEGPFRLYKKYSPPPSIEFDYEHYNTGVMWIKTPENSIKEKIINLHYNNFTNSSLYLNNDEYAISKFVKEKNIKIKLDKEVNYSYNSKCNRNKIQSIHYCTEKRKYLINSLKML